LNSHSSGKFIEAVFVERPNRFLTIVEIKGRKTYAHLHDPGRLPELLLPGARVILRKENKVNRKTGYTLIMVDRDGVLVSLDTALPNRLFQKAVNDKKISELEGYQILGREVQYKNSRLDFLLSKDNTNNETLCFVEVKSVSLVVNRTAMFPDAPTLRGVKHLRHLMEAMDEGYESCAIFIIQREDADRLIPNEFTDPLFAETLRQASEKGVRILAYKCKVSMDNVEIYQRVNIVL